MTEKERKATFRAGWDAAMRDARRIALAEALSNKRARDRAAAAGRELVATCRQADYETAMRIAAAIRGRK